MTACSHTAQQSPEIRTVTVYPVMPPTVCAGVPAAPEPTASDNEWASYKKRRDDAGDDCRDKLGAVHKAVMSWPAAQGTVPK